MHPTSFPELEAFLALDEGSPQILQAVLQRVTDGCRDLLLFRCSGGTLRITANSEDDTVSVRLQDPQEPEPERLEDVSANAPWASWIGQPLEWGWLTINQQGYADGVLLAFDGL